MKYRISFNDSATIFFYFSLFGDFQNFYFYSYSEYFIESEKNYMSFESPDIELLEAEIKMGVAPSRGLPSPILVTVLKIELNLEKKSSARFVKGTIKRAH